MSKARAVHSRQIRNPPPIVLRSLALKFTGTTVLVVAVGGVIATILVPTNAERIWFSIGPLISTAIGGMLIGRLQR